MKTSILNFVLGACAVAATAIDFAMGGLNCASKPSPAFLESVKEMYHNESIKSTEFGATAAADDKVNIITYIHVVASGYSVSDGYISRQDTFDQIDSLNEGFKDTQWFFLHKGTDWTVNEKWATGQDDRAMKKALRKGNYRTLNIYVQKTVRDGAGGWCTFPERPTQDILEQDGCCVLSSTVVPKQGTTTTHEAGHWMGLLHTFEGGCDGPGDYVDDTPPCTMTQGCNLGIKTCPNSNNGDALTNFMSYNSCRIIFSEGQKKRMRDSYVYYRM